MGAAAPPKIFVKRLDYYKDSDSSHSYFGLYGDFLRWAMITWCTFQCKLLRCKVRELIPPMSAQLLRILVPQSIVVDTGG